MRAATARVGLVSPLSTWESIGALTPLRSARSRSDRPMASRRARMRTPTVGASPRDPPRSSVAVTAIALYVITYICLPPIDTGPSLWEGRLDETSQAKLGL